MAINIEIPHQQEQALRDAWGGNLDGEAYDALVIEGYRSGRFGSATVGKLLQHASRWDTERWLADRGVALNYTLEDLEADRKTLDHLFGKSASVGGSGPPPGSSADRSG
ncbi:MAG: UPF0175 family protein [Phycisphaerae bacterium]|nr:UPF0175 family protein [Phycisphaerae bacterium]